MGLNLDVPPGGMYLTVLSCSLPICTLKDKKLQLVSDNSNKCIYYLLNWVLPEAQCSARHTTGA